MKNKGGFTLISVLISILILAFVTLTLYYLFDFALKVIGENKNRVTAVSIANRQMEMIRNLPYDSIGTSGGIPSGTIPQNQEVYFGGKPFTVDTEIVYIDDPFDGTATTTPPDLYNADYKRVTVAASWQSRFYKTESVYLVTDISPKGIESGNGGGTLIISVFDANGFAVPLADVNIINNSVTPIINIDAQTGDDGILVYPGAPPSLQSYEITVTKEGYSTDYTSPVTIENPNPTKPHASVFEGLVTEVSFAIDLVSTFEIEAINQDVATEWQISTDLTGSIQNFSDVGIDGYDNYYFIWHDQRTGQERIFAQKYNSNMSQQWTSDIQVVSSNNQIYPRMSTDLDGNSYYCWQDDRNGNQDIYLLKYDTDGIGVWDGERKVNTEASNVDQNLPVVAASTSTVYIVWQDDRNGNLDIFAQRYSADGTKLWANDVKINSDSGTASQSYPDVEIDDDNNFYIVWQDNRNGDLDIYAQKYNANGAKQWENDVRVNSGSTSDDQYYPALDLGVDNNVYAAWQDDRNGDSDIYVQKYSSSGTKIWTNDLLANTDNLSVYQGYPDIGLDSSNNFYIVWEDNRNGDTDIYAQKYDQDGVAIWESDVKLNNNIDNSDQRRPRVQVDSADYGIFTWFDNRNGDYDIYAAKFLDPGTIIYLPNISLHIQGSKTIGTDPIIYKYDEIYATDSNGGLILNNMEWDSYSITPTSTSYVLVNSIPGQPVNLLPNTTTPVTLILSDE